MAYAKNTKVAVPKSRTEIEATIKRYGAGAFYYGTDNKHVLIGFQSVNRAVRIKMPLPAPEEYRTHLMHEQEIRRRWRALALVIKAKLEAVEAGISTFENEFLGFILTADGRTVGEAIAPQLALEYQSGKPTRFLLGPAEVG